MRAIRVGTLQTAPDIDEVIGALQRPDQNVIASLAGVPAADRPKCFASLLPRIQELRKKTGHPHWTVLDEAHRLSFRQTGAPPRRFSSPDGTMWQW